MGSNALYERDFYAWTQAQAAALRGKRWDVLDLEHLAEEIESLGKRDRRALESHLRVLLTQLLKWRYQPDQRARRGLSWRRSLRNARDAIEQVLRDSPSLRGKLPEALAWAYPRACEQAADETGLPLRIFPETWPWSLEQLQDRHFLPEAAEEAHGDSSTR
jgi:hypothetical protein